MSDVSCGVYQSLTEEQWLSVLPVMQELRPQYSLEQLKKQMMLQFTEGYHLVVACVEDKTVGLAGGVFGHKLALGNTCTLMIWLSVKCKEAGRSGRLS